MPTLPLSPLDATTFAPFGQIIAPEHAAQRYPINDGTSERFHDLARVDTASAEGRTLLSIFRAEPRSLPFPVRMLERHPLGSQAFVPLDPSTRYLVVVAESAADAPKAFLLEGGVGVNLARGVWHHPLLALDRVSDFLVIDRGGPGENCDEISLSETWTLTM
ncbi:MAG: ureidoglycolate lyase [Xanthomonadales bacterium]|nr:ureidoglycolate lyase [Xanthomonadales bacterium]